MKQMQIFFLETGSITQSSFLGIVFCFIFAQFIFPIFFL